MDALLLAKQRPWPTGTVHLGVLVTAIVDAVQLASTVIYVLLALIAARLWLRHRSQAAAWVASAFVIIGLAVLLGEALPEEDPPTLAIKGLILAILALPVFLHLFVVALEGIGQRLGRVLLGAAGALGVVTLLLPTFPDPDEDPGTLFGLYTIAFLALWAVLLGRTAWRLLRASRGQPGVIRWRMRVLGSASIGLGLSLVLPTAIADDEVSLLVQSVLGIVSGLLYLVGFAPPRAARARWRETEDEEFQSAVSRLMMATTRQDVATTVLPSLLGLMGADAGAILGQDGELLASRGLSGANDARKLQEAADEDTVVVLDLARGDQLLLRSSIYAPLFGEDERRLLHRLVGMVDLAMDRAALLSSERDARRDAERANREVEAFVATITHDLRNPLTAITGMADLLMGPLGEEVSGRAQTFVERIFANAQYMTGLVQDVLDLARINRSTMASEPVDLERIAGLVRDELAIRAPAAEVVVRQLPQVLGDETQLRRLVDNVVNNAVKHGGREDVRVEIGAHRVDEATVHITFRDNGAGVPPELAESLFELFEQAPGSEGSGLGLAICRKIAEAMGGRLWFEPSPAGADLRLALPSSAVLGPMEGARDPATGTAAATPATGRPGRQASTT